MKVSGPESLAFILLLTVYLPQNSHSSNATRFRDLVKVLAFIISKPKGKKNHPCFLQIFDYAFASSIHILMFWQKKKAASAWSYNQCAYFKREKNLNLVAM